MNQEQQDAGKKGTNTVPNDSKEKEEKRKKRHLGLFLVVIPIFFILLIIWLWPTSVIISKSTAPEKNKKPVAEKITENTGTEAAQPETQPNQPTEETQTEQNTNKDLENEKEKGENPQWSEKTNLLFKIKIPFELRMILLVLLAGAFGSYIYVARAFIYHIGFRTFTMEWYWWYLLRIPIGAALALIFSILIQGGFYVMPASGSETNPSSVIGLAGLIGMFSRQAIEKLEEISNAVFKQPKEDNNEKNNGNNDNEKTGDEDDEKGGKNPKESGK